MNHLDAGGPTETINKPLTVMLFSPPPLQVKGCQMAVSALPFNPFLGERKSSNKRTGTSALEKMPPDYACNPKFTYCLHSCLNSWQPMSVHLTVNVGELSIFYVIIVIM